MGEVQAARLIVTWLVPLVDCVGRIETSAGQRAAPSACMPKQGGQRPGNLCAISWSTQPLPSGSLKVA